MQNEHLYEVHLNWNYGRKGTLTSPALDLPLEVATPPEFPKGIEGVWSPEHLFVASVSSCLMTTFLAVAENSQLEFSDFTVRALGKLEKTDGKFMVSEITLFPVITIADEKHEAKAIRILEKSEAACLISNSVKSKIHLEGKVVIGAMT